MGGSRNVSEHSKKTKYPLLLQVSDCIFKYNYTKYIFISWRQTELCLDAIIQKIKTRENEEGIKYDAVVGIKTGGAIISDYISDKLGLPNYKIKMGEEKNNCKKTIKNSIYKSIIRTFKKNKNYTMCEGIVDNIQGKNIILIDELISTGETMLCAYKYLKNEKGVNDIYVSSISVNFLDNENEIGFLNYKRYKLFIENQKIINSHFLIKEYVLIWPWGYDN